MSRGCYCCGNFSNLRSQISEMLECQLKSKKTFKNVLGVVFLMSAV